MNREAYIGWRLYQYYEEDYLSFDYKQAVFQFTSLQVNKENLIICFPVHVHLCCLYQYYEGDYLSFDYKQAVFQFTSLQANKEKLIICFPVHVHLCCLKAWLKSKVVFIVLIYKKKTVVEQRRLSCTTFLHLKPRCGYA